MMKKGNYGDLLGLSFQHSPSNQHKSKFASEMLDFRGWESFRKCVSNHFVGWTIDESERPVFDDPSNKMESDVDMLGSRMVLMVFGECNRQLVVRKQGGGSKYVVKELGNERAKPEGFFRGIGSCNIFTLSSRERNYFLLFSTPRNGAIMQKKCIP